MNSDTNGHIRYSVVRGAKQALQALRQFVGDQLPPEVDYHLGQVIFSTSSDGHRVYFPCPFKENEAAAALKAVEASIVAAIADLRFGTQRRKIDVNLEKTAAFLFSAYIATIGGMDKADPGVKSKLKGGSSFNLLSAITNAHHRYRFVPRTIYIVSKTVGKLIRNEETWRIFPYSWFP